MKSSSDALENSAAHRFFNNRILNRRKQFRYWKLNWRSGLIRFLERLLIGVNISDRLGGDLTQFTTSPEFYAQVIESRILSSASILETVRINLLGSPQVIEIAGISKERRILRLSSAKVDSYTGLITTDTGLVIDSALPQWQKLIFMGGMLDAYKSSKSKPQEFKGRCAVLPFSEYFFHTLIEEIATLLSIREVFPEFLVITHIDTPKWALELLHELGFEFETVKTRSLVVEELLCATSVAGFSSKEFLLFSKTVHDIQPQTGGKIFISRSNLSRNDDLLENEILKILEPEGFKVVVPEELSINEQIRVFRSASEIISFHGGALSHLIWCSKGTKILEIFNHPYRLYDFARIAHEGELNYSALDTLHNGFKPEDLRLFLSE
jgi:hypothetical protein